MSRALNVSGWPKSVVIVKLESSSLPPSESPLRAITRSRLIAPPFASARPRRSMPAPARSLARGLRAVELVLHHHAALHHRLHALQLGDVLQLIAGDRNQLGVVPALGRAVLVLPLHLL